MWLIIDDNKILPVPQGKAAALRASKFVGVALYINHLAQKKRSKKPHASRHAPNRNNRLWTDAI
jgi:hypothetical protein